VEGTVEIADEPIADAGNNPFPFVPRLSEWLRQSCLMKFDSCSRLGPDVGIDHSSRHGAESHGQTSG
jgi:hypothetical protein